jgi:hypothetical protein
MNIIYGASLPLGGADAARYKIVFEQHQEQIASDLNRVLGDEPLTDIDLRVSPERRHRARAVHP